MFLSLFGVVIVLSKGEIHRILTFHFNSGDLWMTAAVILWGVYSVCGRWAMKKVSPIMATFYSGVFGIMILLPFNLSSFNVSQINTSFILSLFYTGIVSTVICMLLWNIAVQNIGATKAGIFLNFNPVFTAILAFLILKEKMSFAELGGSIFVIMGCFLFSRLKKLKKHSPANLYAGETFDYLLLAILANEELLLPFLHTPDLLCRNAEFA